MIYKRSNTTIHGFPSNQRQLADELHKPIIKKFQKRKVCFFYGKHSGS